MRAEAFHGGAHLLSLTGANKRWEFRWDFRLVTAVTSTSGRGIRLNDARTYMPGAFIGAVINWTGSTDSFVLKDDGGTTLATVPVGEMAFIHLHDNSTADGTWRIDVRSYDA